MKLALANGSAASGCGLPDTQRHFIDPDIVGLRRAVAIDFKMNSNGSRTGLRLGIETLIDAVPLPVHGDCHENCLAVGALILKRQVLPSVGRGSRARRGGGDPTLVCRVPYAPFPIGK